MHPWPPEPTFMKFLNKLEERAGDDMPKGVWVMIMEIRAGGARGKFFYEQMMDDKVMRTIYEAWKSLE